MTTPNQQQIEAIAKKLADSLGGGVHIRATDLMVSVDSAFPGMTEGEFGTAREVCIVVAEQIRCDALSSMWGESS